MTLIAWGADGFPIYARYGYSVADDTSSLLKNMTGSYQLVSDNVSSRPSTQTGADETLYFDVGLFGKNADTQTLELTASRKSENHKQKFNLSPENNVVKLGFN